MKSRIAHIILSVTDLERSIAFYDPLMKGLGFGIGLNEQDDKGGIRAYRQGEHGLYILSEKDKQHESFVRFPGLNHICFGVDQKEDVDEIHEIVKKLGAKITREPKHYPEYTEKYYAFYFRDPDGIPLEVAFI